MQHRIEETQRLHRQRPRSRRQRRQRLQLITQLGLGADRLADATHGDQAISRRAHFHDRRDRARRVRRPALPGREHPRGMRLRQGPGDAEHQRGLQRKGADHKLRGDTKTAAAAPAARPIEIRLGGGARLQRPGLAVDHGDLLKAVAGQTMRPCQQPMAATGQVTGDADRRTTTGLQRKTLGSCRPKSCRGRGHRSRHRPIGKSLRRNGRRSGPQISDCWCGPSRP